MKGRTTRRALGRPRAEEAGIRTETLLDAATEVFLERGFAGASTREIARRAGASKETLYARYPSKAALFAALVERKSDKMLASVEDSMREDVPPEKALAQFGFELLSTMLHPDAMRLHQVVTAEARDFPELALAFWDKGPGRGREVLKRYLHALVRRKLIRAKDVELAAEQFLGALLGGVSLRNSLGLVSPLRDQAAVRGWVELTVRAFVCAHLVGR